MKDLGLDVLDGRISGASTTYRIPDAYVPEFIRSVVPQIPGGVTWITQDETTGAISSVQHSDLLGVTANQHHAQVHSIGGADHTGTLAHTALGSVGADDHHAKSHAHNGADGSGTVAHSSTSGITATDHHAAAVAGPDADVTIDAAGAAGTASTFARSAHGHKISTYASIPAVDTTTGNAGTSGTAPARGDHAHIGVESRTSMPGTPATNARVFRTDLGMEFYYDGTRWLSSILFRADLPSLLNAAATATAQGSAVASDGTDIYVVNRVVSANVATGGTALGASHNWSGTLRKVDVNGAETVIDTYTINSGSSGVWRKQTNAINALLTSGSFYILKDTWTKTGTPGNFTMSEYYTYRVVTT